MRRAEGRVDERETLGGEFEVARPFQSLDDGAEYPLSGTAAVLVRRLVADREDAGKDTIEAIVVDRVTLLRALLALAAVGLGRSGDELAHNDGRGADDVGCTAGREDDEDAVDKVVAELAPAVVVIHHAADALQGVRERVARERRLGVILLHELHKEADASLEHELDGKVVLLDVLLEVEERELERQHLNFVWQHDGGGAFGVIAVGLLSFGGV